MLSEELNKALAEDSSLATVCAYAKEVIAIEAETLRALIAKVDENFYRAFQLIATCTGTVFLSGVGKAGLVGQKISATFASIGVPSQTLHPTEALHGDLGRVRQQDLLIVLSNSGETEETKRLVYALKQFKVPIISITGNSESSIARLSDVGISTGKIQEACPLGLAPTASTVAAMAIGDALAMSIVRSRRFSRDDFAAFHPQGNIGFRLMKVCDIMRAGDKLPLATPYTLVREVVTLMTITPGRPGAAIVVDEQNQLLGIFTDGNLRRLLQDESTAFLSDPIHLHMTLHPKRIHESHCVEEVAALFKAYKIDQCPVLNSADEVVGLMDIQDIL